VGVHVRDTGVEVGGLYPLYQLKYAMLTQRFKDVVVAHFYGHDHVDEVRLITSCRFTAPNPGSSSINDCGGAVHGALYVGQVCCARATADR
jgi:hypothetical protein